MKVDINEIMRLKMRLAEINSAPFDSLVFMDGDKGVAISPERREEWKFIGLTNSEFIFTEFYLKGWESESLTKIEVGA